jgi:hypothetical protein
MSEEVASDRRGRFGSPPAAVRDDQHTDAGETQKATVDGPLGLARHEAAGEDVDALEKPDAPDEQAQSAGDVQRDSHTRKLSGPSSPIVPMTAIMTVAAVDAAGGRRRASSSNRNESRF